MTELEQVVTQKPTQKVGICVPSMDIWPADFGMCFAYMLAYNTTKIIQGPANVRGYLPVVARNDMVKACLDAGLDWIFQVDSDMTFPPDTVMRLLAHDKPMVGALYLRRVAPHVLLGVPTDRDNPITLESTGLRQMDRMPTGCLLTHRSIYEKFPYPWYETRMMMVGDKPSFDEDGVQKIVTEDYILSDKCRHYGVEMYADLDLSKELGHIVSNRVVWGNMEPPSNGSTAA